MKKKFILIIKGRYKFTLRDVITGKVRVFEYENLIPTVGRAAIANRLTDATPYTSLRCNYTALGTGITAPANGNTTLETEVYRKLIASASNVNNVAYITAFYNTTEVTGTFKEAGIFIDGTGVVDSGTLFSRIAIDITKTNTETLTIDYEVTIS